MLDQLTEWLALTAQRRKIAHQFKKSMGYAGNFENPKSFQEKIQFRKLYGNHAFYALVADKYRARNYVASKIGEEYLIPLLGAYDRLEEATFDKLPQQFIIKANHGCKWHEVVHDKNNLDITRVIRRFNKLCKSRYGSAAGETHYNFIPPKIVIEELLRGRHDGLPWDYNFFCYNGPAGFDYNFSIATPSGKAAGFYKDWTLASSDIPERELEPYLRPANFDRMVDVARKLSRDFDFVRVDLYSVGDKVYFGELTCTPHQGYGIIPDPKRQKMRDEMWHLDSGNPLLYCPPRTHRSRRRSPVAAYVCTDFFVSKG